MMILNYELEFYFLTQPPSQPAAFLCNKIQNLSNARPNLDCMFTMHSIMFHGPHDCSILAMMQDKLTLSVDPPKQNKKR